MKTEKAITKISMITVLAWAITAVLCAGAIAPAIGAPSLPLTTQEKDMLTFMREEEKMARDVYLEMFEKWGAAIFSNIAVSEQRHMDTMKKMLDKYRMPDPAEGLAIGDFANLDLQAKYDELIGSGSKSYVDALYAGATIEEIDMVDIQHALDVTTHIDLRTAYQNLLEGSKNHLRSFVRALAAQGVTYAPQTISQELYNTIMGL